MRDQARISRWRRRGDRAAALHAGGDDRTVGVRPPASVGAGVGRRPVGRRIGAARRSRPPRPADGPAPAPVGAAGPVRRLLRGRQAGLLRGREPDRRRSSRAARTSSRRRVGSQAGRPRVHDQLGPEGPRGPRGGAPPTSSTSPRSSSAPARCRWPGRTPASTSRASSPARRSASGTSATSSRSPPALLTCGLTPGLENNGDPTKQYQKVIQAST